MKNSIKLVLTSVLTLTVVFLHAQERYSLQWKKAETFKVSRGIIYPDHWEVKNDSAIFSTGNIVINEPGKRQYKAFISISQEGTLQPGDQAIVYYILNESIAKSFVIKGNELEEKANSDFAFTTTKPSVLKINIVFKSMGDDRSWKLTNNSVKMDFIASITDPEMATVVSGDCIKLSWKQKTDAASNYFIVERSLNGQDFRQVALIKASPANVNGQFAFKDKINGASTIYYRVKLRDYSGDEKQIGEVMKCNPENDLTLKDN